MEDFKKFDLNEKTPTVATDNTLPPKKAHDCIHYAKINCYCSNGICQYQHGISVYGNPEPSEQIPLEDVNKGAEEFLNKIDIYLITHGGDRIYQRSNVLKAMQEYSSTQRQQQNREVLSWLGYWRDKLPIEAIHALQDILIGKS